MLKVVMVVGFARSGSTLLGNLLGEYGGVRHVGEARMLWKRDLNRVGPRCGCGKPFEQCEWWSDVLGQWAAHPAVGHIVLGDESHRSPTELARHMVKLQRASERGGRQDPERLATADRYVAATAALYESIARADDTSVIVDTSKRPAHARLLHKAPGLDPFVLHLVRDPRGVINSRQKKRARSSESGPSRYQMAADAIKWVARNRDADRVRTLLGPERSMLVRYEDLAADPRGVIEDILARVGIDAEPSPFIEANLVDFGDNHAAGGNRARFVRGETAITQDVKWRSRMRPSDATLIASLTRPAFRRYGYLPAGIRRSGA